MGLSKLKQKRPDGVEYIENRGALYYNKHRFRARVISTGMTALWWAKTEEDLYKRLASSKKYYKDANPETLKNVLNWFNNNPKKKCGYASRIEGNIASVFSNDLNFLKTLESTGAHVDYTEVENTVPEGTKYFVNEPKYKYRVYLRSKRVPDDFHNKLREFFERYENTDTVMNPSNALSDWMIPLPKHTMLNSWRNYKKMFCSSSFFFDYNDESTLTLFMLVFDGMVSRKCKLEKRPD